MIRIVIDLFKVGVSFVAKLQLIIGSTMGKSPSSLQDRFSISSKFEEKRLEGGGGEEPFSKI